jgi:hypothetical protein
MSAVQLGSGLTNPVQNHVGCIGAARFFADCLRVKAGLAPVGQYELAKTNEILDSAWNDNSFDANDISAFEWEVYSALFKLAPEERFVKIWYDIPELLANAAQKAGIALKRGDLPVETNVYIKGLTVNVYQGYTQQGVYVAPFEATL